MNTLYFLPAEKKVFSLLPADMQKGWTIEPEVLTYADTPERRAFRFKMLRVHDKQLVRFREKALSAKNPKEFMDLAATIDLRTVDNRDLTSIVFALGPDVMSMIIAGILESPKNHEDLELAAAFAALRHGMLESFSEISLTRS